MTPLTFVLSVPILAAAAPPKLGGKKPSKRPAWDLKGQLCDLNAELKCCREKTQTLDQENQQLRDQLREAQQQAMALGAERRTLEGELSRVRAQAEHSQQELGNLSAHVLELEERLSTQESLVEELQQEQLGLQEERRGLATRLEEQEVRASFSPNAALGLGLESLTSSVQQHTSLLDPPSPVHFCSSPSLCLLCSSTLSLCLSGSKTPKHSLSLFSCPFKSLVSTNWIELLKFTCLK